MKLSCACASYGVLIALVCVVPAIGAEGSTPRVIWRAHKDKANAETVDKVIARVGQVIEIDWQFAAVPDQIPSTNDAKSSNPCVSVTGIGSILTVPPQVGVGMVGAAFRAEKEGKAILNITLTNKTGTVTLKCEVEVIK